MLKFGLSIGMLPVVSAVSDRVNANSRITPPQTKGPFYPIHQQDDKDADLVTIQGRGSKASGKVINVVGRVLSLDGKPLENAMVEIWQADANGRYRHKKDPNPAPLDPDFQGWGISRSDARGNYRFVTLFPGAYPAGPEWMRPPHIHFKIVMDNYKPLITQMYFPGHSLNQSDLILQNLSKADQAMVISKKITRDTSNDNYQFDIYLQAER